MSEFTWPVHTDGSNKSIGEMTPDERLMVMEHAARHLQVDLNNPNSAFRRVLTVILNAPVVPKTRQ
jgi:hypothetical protein